MYYHPNQDFFELVEVSPHLYHCPTTLLHENNLTEVLSKPTNETLKTYTQIDENDGFL